jgi:hypothetical protein
MEPLFRMQSWFNLESMQVPVIVPTIVPFRLPTPLPMFVPLVMPTVVMMPIPMMQPGVQSRWSETTWKPVPLEVEIANDNAPTQPAPTPQMVVPAATTEPASSETETEQAAPANTPDAPNFPVQIASLNKIAEIVVLKNVSDETVDLSGWRMVSVTGEQQHPDISGTLNPGESRSFPNMGKKIWRNDSRDDGALYDAGGALVSYWSDV